MSDGSIESQAERQRERDAWSSPWYPALFFLVAMPIEIWCWWKAPFMQLGWQVVLGLTIVIAAVPWIGSRQHRADSETLRRHPARFGFLLPALLLHAGMAALYGPYWNAGREAGDGSITINRLLGALLDRQAMATMLVDAAARPDDRSLEIAFLLRLGADANAADARGRHPLDVVADGTSLDRLLDTGAVRHSAAIGRTLIVLAREGDTARLVRLLALGVDADATDPDGDAGYTAAHEAAYSGHAETLRALLAAGADPDRRDAHGKTVTDRAGDDPDLLAVLAEFDRRAPVPASGAAAVE